MFARMKLSFHSYSLLYGLSYLWLVMQIVNPYHIWPNFGATQSNHILKSWPRLLHHIEIIGRSTRAIYWNPKVTLVAFVALNITLTVMQNDVQEFFLSLVKIKDTSRLTYKVVRYLPILLVSKIRYQTV